MHDTVGSSFFFGPFELDLTEQRLVRGGQAVALTPKAFELLRILVTHNDRLVMKEDLVRQVWPDTFVDPASLARAISVVRAALLDGAGTVYIETVPKRGYRFVAPVSRSRPLTACASPVTTKARRVPIALGLTAAAVGLLVLATVRYLLVADGPDATFGSVAGPIHRQLTSTGRETAAAISPDGGEVAYVSQASRENLLIVQDLAGRQRVVAFRAPEINNVRWSPDGQRLLLFARDEAMVSGIFVVSRSGGAARKIADGAFKACWSPDGSLVAVGVLQRGLIVLVDEQGRHERLQLHGTHRWIWDIDWSPAADRLLLVSDNDEGQYRIWTIRPDGTEQQLVHEDRVELRGARWAPDGRTIYFSRRDDQTTSLFKVTTGDRRTSQPMALPLLSGLESGGAFTVSSNGRQLAYVRAPFHSNLWAIDMRAARRGDATVRRQLTSGTTLVERPRISPDGQSVVFNRGYDGRANLFVMPVAGGSPRQLTFLNGLSLGGVWSPDGAQLAFVSNEGGRPRPWVVAADGGSARLVSDGPVSDSYAVAWSSRSRLLYQRPDNRDFLVVDPAASRDEGPLLGDTALGWVFSPELAPDGRRLALEWNQLGRHGVWVFDLEGGRRTLVRQEALTPIGWAAGGRSIYALKAKPGAHRGPAAILGETIREARLIEVPMDGGPAREVLALPFEEVGGVSVSADGRTIVCAVYSSRSDVWIVEDFDPSSRQIAGRAISPGLPAERR